MINAYNRHGPKHQIAQGTSLGASQYLIDDCTRRFKSTPRSSGFCTVIDLRFSPARHKEEPYRPFLLCFFLNDVARR